MNEQDEWFATNRAMWDELVPLHVDSAHYDVEGFLAGASTLREFDLEDLGDVTGRTLVHTQCHFGLDTLSWARRGARVTGLDFSGPGVAAARALAARAGIEAEFIEANVYDAVDELGGRRFDIVYTGLGALNWLPDLDRWARVMATLLAPGGTFYLAEFHPFSWVFGDDDLSVTYPYFQEGPNVWDEQGSYAVPDAKNEHTRTYEWTHPLGDVVTSLIRAGLRIELLREHDYVASKQWPFLEETARGIYRLPADVPSLPLMYSVRASHEG